MNGLNFHPELRQPAPLPPRESPLRGFHLTCHRCRSYRCRFQAGFEEEAGELRLKIICSNCGFEELTVVPG